MLNYTDDMETKQVLSSMILLNMEGEGISDVRKYFRAKLVRMGVIEPNEQEMKELEAESQNAQPSANDQYLMAAAMKEQAEAGEKQANTILKQAQADKAQADTVKTLSEIEQSEIKLALEASETISPRGLDNGEGG